MIVELANCRIDELKQKCKLAAKSFQFDNLKIRQFDN